MGGDNAQFANIGYYNVRGRFQFSIQFNFPPQNLSLNHENMVYLISSGCQVTLAKLFNARCKVKNTFHLSVFSDFRLRIQNIGKRNNLDCFGIKFYNLDLDEMAF